MVLPPLSPLCCSSSPPYFMASIRSAFFQSIDHGCNSDNQSLHHQLAGLFKTKTRQEVKYEGQHESTDCRAKDPAPSAAKGDATQDDCSNRVQNHVLPNAGIGQDMILNSIAAVILGGVTFGGGRGRILGPAVGAFMLTFVFNFLTSFGFEESGKLMMQGLIIAVAAMIDGLKKR